MKAKPSPGGGRKATVRHRHCRTAPAKDCEPISLDDYARSSLARRSLRPLVEPRSGTQLPSTMPRTLGRAWTLNRRVAPPIAHAFSISAVTR